MSVMLWSLAVLALLVGCAPTWRSDLKLLR